jgi:alpha-glucosidase
MQYALLTYETAGAKSWLPLNAGWPTRNVARMTEESHSILTLYRRLLALRRDCRALSIGDFGLLIGEDTILAYERRHDSERLIVALNLGERPRGLRLPDWTRGSRLLLSTVDDGALVEGDTLLLGSNEGVILEAG